MAIKGKTKHRSRRVVAAPPPPPVYVRKKPLFLRRWFLATLAGLAAAGILAAVLVAIDNRGEEALRERTAKAVDDFASRVRRTFPPPPDSEPTPPTGMYVMYPSLISDLDAVERGDRKVDGPKKGKSLEESARATGDAIQGVQVRRLVPAEAEVGELPKARGPGATRGVLLESQFLMVEAFRLYESVGALMRQAAAAPAKARKPIVAEARDLTTRAHTLFQRGYQKILTLQSHLGTLELTPFQPGGMGGP